MRFLLDEGLPFRLVVFLEQGEHDVSVCGRDHPNALDDRDILAIAFSENRTLLTNDKDFGDLVFRDLLPHAGVILFRLGYVSIEARIALLERVLNDYSSKMDQFFVISPQGIRIARQ